MTLFAPTQDRILLGLVAGAAAGGILLTFSPIGGGGWPIALLSFFVLALYLPLVFLPLWWSARALRLPDVIGAPLGGALALLASPVVIDLIVSRRLPAAADWSDLALILLGVGSVVGLVTWRVARWNVDAQSNGG